MPASSFEPPPVPTNFANCVLVAEGHVILVATINAYCCCQFQASVELVVNVATTLLVAPLLGILPVPVQPVLRYRVPFPSSKAAGTEFVATVNSGIELLP